MIDKIYPLSKIKGYDSDIQQLEQTSFFCNICGCHSKPIVTINKNIRDSIKCEKCKSINRQRQLASIFLKAIQFFYPLREIKSLSDLDSKKPHYIFNAENNGAFHRILSQNLDSEFYISSEFIKENLSSGVFVDNILHQDLQKLSFENNSFDYVLTAEVFEHIPNPYLAFSEIYRVLILMNNKKS